MKENNSEIRIYVACLAAYNNGSLHGVWINACQDVVGINNSIRDMLAASPIENAEEYAIHDYEGFEGLSIAEYCGIDQIAEYASFIDEHSALGSELIIYYGGDIETAQKAMEDQYYGCYTCIEEFAQQLTEETTQIPENLNSYIDYEKMARDLEINDIIAIETGFEEVHIFWSH